MIYCERCWEDAYGMMRYTGRPQSECYTNILKLRKNRGELCTQEQQAGKFWDKEKQCDIRLNKYVHNIDVCSNDRLTVI